MGREGAEKWVARGQESGWGGGFSTRYLTSEGSERVRYRVNYWKIKFFSTRGHVTFSIYLVKTLHLQRNFAFDCTFASCSFRKDMATDLDRG